MSTGRNGSTPPSTISVGGTPASLARCAANRPATRPVSVVEARGRADHCRITSGSARSAKREQFAFKRRRARLAAADDSAGRLDRLHRELSRALRGRRRSVRGLGAGGARSGLDLGSEGGRSWCWSANTGSYPVGPEDAVEAL